MRKIYTVEDDEEIREIVLYALRAAGFEASGFENGAGLFKEIAKPGPLPSAVLLDIMLPGDDGLFILKRLRCSSRTKSMPIIILSAKGSEFDRVKGLDLGADDYLPKPFGVMELISRVNAVIRRSGEPEPAAASLVYGDLALDSARRVVLSGGENIALTFKEYELLSCLMLNTGIAMSRDRIMEAVWGYDFEGESRTLDMHIRSLRQKLGSSGEYIRTIRGVGYKLGE